MSTEHRKITIFDTTLRDGEQSPGCSMNLSEELEVAQALVEGIPLVSGDPALDTDGITRFW